MEEERYIELRIGELLEELNSCREDERNAQNQILQVIMIVCTVLGILFGTSYIVMGTDQPNIPLKEPSDSWSEKLLYSFISNITVARVIYLLSILVFGVAFLYVIYLGMGNILRYFYIQNIEDRLAHLIPALPDDVGRGRFLHWNTFSAPILTKNAKHITSSHTFLNFFAYSGSILLAMMFCLVLIVALLLKITPVKTFDIVVLIVIIVIMFAAFLLYMRYCSHSARVIQFAWDMAHENQKVRLGSNSMKDPYSKAKSFWQTLGYLIWPGAKDPQKPILVIAGYAYGILVQGNRFGAADAARLLSVLFVFEFLAYQTRYQINDIRGMSEKQENGRTKWMVFDSVENERHFIKISSIIAFLRIMLAFIISTLSGGRLRWILLVGLCVLLCITAVYEAARHKKNTFWIFVLVGAGYPLRFFLGYFAAVNGDVSWPAGLTLVCVVSALWFYGAFSSILAWVEEIVETIRVFRSKGNGDEFPKSYAKSHYTYLQGIIKDRCQKSGQRGDLLPLRERGSLKDPWAILFFLSMAMLWAASYTEAASGVQVIIESAVIMVLGMLFFCSARMKLVLFCVCWVLLLAKTGLTMVLQGSSASGFLLFSLQLVVTMTYFILSYRPKFRKIQIKTILTKLIFVVLGRYAGDLLKKDMEKTE